MEASVRLPLVEVAVAIRVYEATPELCLIGETPAPTLAAWLAWCQDVYRLAWRRPSDVFNGGRFEVDG